MVWNVSWRFCRAHTIRGYFFRFPLAVIDGENKRIRANRPLEEGSVSCYRLLLDKLQGKIDSAAVEYVFSRGDMAVGGWFCSFSYGLGVRMMLRGLLLPVMRGVLFLCRGSLVCWRNVEGANISNSAGHDKDKIATLLFFS